MIKTPIKAFHFSGIMSYIAIYDPYSGSRNRYAVIVLNEGEPICIGREIPIREVAALVADHEAVAATTPLTFIGDHKNILDVRRKVTAIRRKRAWR